MKVIVWRHSSLPDLNTPRRCVWEHTRKDKRAQQQHPQIQGTMIYLIKEFAIFTPITTNICIGLKKFVSWMKPITTLLFQNCKSSNYLSKIQHYFLLFTANIRLYKHLIIIKAILYYCSKRMNKNSLSFTIQFLDFCYMYHLAS